MSESPFQRCILLAAPAELAARFFIDGEAWYRLNPEWEVLALDNQQLKVRYERSEQEVDYRRPASTEFSARDGSICATRLFAAEQEPRTITLTLTPQGDNTRLDWHEIFPTPLETARRAELNLWVDAAAGYLAFAARKDFRARLAHWLLDRFWLRMSPTSRRVSLLIVGMETLALLLFIAILIVYRFVS